MSARESPRTAVDSDDEPEDVDIEALREIARRLDIPIQELLRRLQSTGDGEADDDCESSSEGGGGSASDSNEGRGPSINNSPSGGRPQPQQQHQEQRRAPTPPLAEQKRRSSALSAGSAAPPVTSPTSARDFPVVIPVHSSAASARAGGRAPGYIRIRGVAEELNSGLDMPPPPPPPPPPPAHPTRESDSHHQHQPLLWDSPAHQNHGGVEVPDEHAAPTADAVRRRTSSHRHSSLSGRVSASGRSSERRLRRASRPPQSQQASPKKNVRFDTLEEVHVFEVDDSLFISIEYSRPLIGWILLLVGLVLTTVVDVIDTYKMGMDPDSSFGFSTGHAMGAAAITLLFVVPVWYCFMKPSRREGRYLKSGPGLLLVCTTGIIWAMGRVAEQSASKITDQWRGCATYALHPAFIVLYGKVFKSTVFIEELIGCTVLVAGFGLAMVPTDIQVPKWEFAEVITLAQAIYVASFLFLCVKVRANQVSVPVILGTVTLFSVAVQIIVCAIAGIPFDNKTRHSVFEFALNGTSVALWVVTSFARVMAFACYLLTLRFIPPLTVSATLVLVPIIAQLVGFLLFFNQETAVWDVCTPYMAGQADGTGAENYGNNIFCRDTAFHYTYVFGSFAALCGVGYLIYVSSIKRSKVELLIKKLRKRRVPKNPYKSRYSGGGADDGGGGDGGAEQEGGGTEGAGGGAGAAPGTDSPATGDAGGGEGNGGTLVSRRSSSSSSSSSGRLGKRGSTPRQSGVEVAGGGSGSASVAVKGKKRRSLSPTSDARGESMSSLGNPPQ